MDFLNVSLPTLAENVALDEALLLEAEAGGPALLRVWEWSQFAVVLGAVVGAGAALGAGASAATAVLPPLSFFPHTGQAPTP